MATEVTIDGTPTNGANPWIDSLVWGGRWTDADGGTTTIGYSFMAGFDSWSGATGSAWLSSEMDAVNAAMVQWETVANVDFVETSSGSADIWYWVVDDATMSALVEPGILGWHEVPGYSAGTPLYGLFNYEGDGWNSNGLTPGGYGFVTLIHELGHGLGLAHPHDGGDAPDATLFPGVTSAFDDYGDFGLNQGIWTTMSYNDGWKSLHPSPSLDYGFQLTPMALDIAALQLIYGANTTYHSGGDSYVLPTANTVGTGWSCIWDVGGTDTINAVGAGGSCVIDLRSATLTGANAGGYVSWITGIFGGFTIANGVVIENALGGNFSDSIFGNDNANYLDGALGSDTLRGFGGNDTYVVNVSGDVVTELAGVGTGTDTIEVASTFAAVAGVVTYSIASKANVENLTYLGTNKFTGTGNTLNNTITGGIGNDILDGGVGIDTLIGGDGDDTYTVATAGDTVDETGGSGIDLVKSAISFSLVDGAGQVIGDVENLTLTGALAINGTGNALVNKITGNTGANIIEGKELGDTLDGAAGIDTLSYASSGSGVTVVLNGAALGTVSGGDAQDDQVKNFENIIGSASIDTLTGDGLANVIDGGAGADIMAGLAGNDTYVVDNVGDKANELAAGGTDLVKSSVDFTLDVNVENLTLTGGADIDGTGNGLVNILTGNTGANRLDGGVGADTMIGGLGNDTYVVNVSGDVVTELAGAGTGTDTIEVASTFAAVAGVVTYSIASKANVENLTYLGTNKFTGTGNTLNNTITGGIGNDILDGGVGIDTLIGGDGDDTYTVATAGDTVDETGGSGIDLVKSAISFSLVDGAGQVIGDVENLTLTGALAINGTGNALVNKITGNTGANIIEGKELGDTLDGAAGIDTLSYASSGSGVTVVLNGAALGTVSGGDAQDDQVKNFENIIGSASIDTLTGDGLANVIDGGAGADIMAGLAGNDTYVVDNVGDKANELAAGGTDLVKSSVDFTLDVNVENLTLTGGADIDGTGNGLVNILTGNTGANRLDGGVGADTMIGGLGNDTYVVNVSGDVVTELAGAGTGTDTIEVASTFAAVAGVVTYSIASKANVENLTYLGTNKFTGTGNTLNNTITGGIGNDILDGGVGIDTLIGGDGDDTYTVATAGDTVDETGGSGIDLVKSAISFSLVDGAGQVIGDVENLTLTGALAINGTGNALVNKITGNTGANIIEGKELGDTLDGAAGIDTLSYASSGSGVTVVLNGAALGTVSGGDAQDDQVKNFENIIGSASIDTLTGDGLANVIDGGAGADIMAGLAGNDTYVVDNVGDKANELAAGGTDLVKSSVDFTLDVNVENLTLTGGADIDGTGNGLVNILTGNTGANRLDGGVGADTMIGGLGNDTYVVDVAGDKVTEVAGVGTGIDTIETSLATFSLAALAAVENLTYTGLANFTGTGNALANTITGGIGADKLSGGTGADTLIGGAGNDTLTGGTQNDQFIFKDFVLDGNFGNDKITDFMGGVGVNDVIQIDGSWGFLTADEVADAFVVVGADKVLTIDVDNSITLVGKAGLALVADDFLII